MVQRLRNLPAAQGRGIPRSARTRPFTAPKPSGCAVALLKRLEDTRIITGPPGGVFDEEAAKPLEGLEDVKSMDNVQKCWHGRDSRE